MQTIISVSIHRKTENPVFGDGNIIVSLADEAAGAFIELTQNPDNNNDVHKIRINQDELDELVSAAKMLLAQDGVE